MMSLNVLVGEVLEHLSYECVVVVVIKLSNSCSSWLSVMGLGGSG